MEIKAFLKELPQNLIGFILSKLKYRVSYIPVDGKYTKIYFLKHFFFARFSFGKYIFFDNFYYGKEKEEMIRKELKRQILSKKYGWFYLLLIAIPYFFRVFQLRTFYRNKDVSKKEKWLNSKYPENLLGGKK